MRILASTTANTGHFLPLVPLARACVAAGHEVRVAAPASFASHVARAGFEHLPFDDVPPDVIGPIFASLSSLSMEEANARVIRDVFAGLGARHAEPALSRAIADWRPDVVLREAVEFGSLAAAVAADVPTVEVSIGLTDMFAWAADHLAEPFEVLADQSGLPPERLWAGLRAAPILTTVPTVVDGPVPAARLVHRYRDGAAVPAHGSLPEAWGDPGLPLVYATFGTVAGGFPEFAAVYRATLDTLADSPIRLLLTTGHAFDPSTLGSPPANARVLRFFPQEQVMPFAAAVVGHGGFGTTMAALVAGVPQVVLPLFAFDQFVNASRLADIGAGLAVEGGPAAVDRLAAAVATVLGDARFATAARAIASDIAALPDVSEAVHVVTDHARTAT